MNKFIGIFELLEYLTSKEGDIWWSRIKCLDSRVPMSYIGILKPTGTAIEVFDDWGNYVGTYRGYRPIKGGNVVYLYY